MKQKVIIQLPMNDQKSRSHALKIAAGVIGVEAVAVIGAEKDQLQVIGEGIDSVTLTRLLRKKLARADLVSVGEAKKEEGAVKKAEASTPQPPVVEWNPPPSYGFPPYQIVEVRDSVNDPSCCTIM
ncbi:hypothetical protein ACJIZ3_010561 [Penstemon smallii]|uniref:HMA domain-containing protein n=1 Tax=Penstemon smallii TaxID=265156 RepID=A0ABD3UGP4_9LAMI